MNKKNFIILFLLAIVDITAFMLGYSLGKIAGWSDGFRTATGSDACKVRKRDYYKAMEE